MKQQQYETLSIIVECHQKFRVFSTNRFTLHPIIQHLQRYNPDHVIICLVHGDIQTSKLNNKCWTELDYSFIDKILQTLPKLWSANQTISKSELLEKYSYRIALNIAYLQDDVNGIYPSLKQFDGIQISKPQGVAKLPPLPVFLADEDSLLADKWDILKYYEGKRVERYYRAEKVDGFIIKSPRW